MNKFEDYSFLYEIKVHPDYVEETLGGTDNFYALVASWIKYSKGSYPKEEPYLMEGFDVPELVPVIALGINETDDGEVLMDMLLCGERVEAYLDEDIVDWLCETSERLLESPDNDFSEEDIDTFAWINGKMFMIDAEDDFIFNMKMIDHIEAYYVIQDYIEEVKKYIKENNLSDVELA